MPENYHAKRRLPLDKGNEFRVEMYKLIMRINEILAAEKRVCALDISFRFISKTANDKVVRVYALADQRYREISLDFLKEHGEGLALEDRDSSKPFQQSYNNSCHTCDECTNGNKNKKLDAWVDDIEFVPSRNSNMPAPSFKDWVNHLKENQFGRFAISLKRRVSHEEQTLVVFLVLKIKPTEIQIEEIAEKLRSFISDHGLEYALLLADSLHTEAVKSTIKSAVAAVMVRNLSHNIGSHVLANLSSRSDLETRYNAQSSKTLFSEIASFNSYLRMRMDFLADIATAVPAIQVPKGLKLIIANFLSEQVVRDYISGSTAIKSSKICIDDRKLVGNSARNDMVFACTNESLGAHAFYVILENIIRNAVKHTDLPQNHLRLTFECSEDGAGEINKNDYWRVKIVDNTGVSKFISNNINDCDKNHHHNLIEELNEMIKKPILEEGKVRHGGWGVLEMKIAAAYLRKLPPEEIESDIEGKKLDPPLLRASDDQGNLCYTLYLPKVKELAIINFGEHLTLTDDSQNNIANKGVRIVDYTGEKTFDLITDYQFMLLYEPSQDHLSEMYSKADSITKRIFISSNAEINEKTQLIPLDMEALIALLEHEDQVEIEAFLWQTWSEALWHKQYPSCKGIVKHGKRKGHIEDCCEPINPSSNQFAKEKYLLFDCHGDNPPSKKDDKIIYYEPFGSSSPSGRLFDESENYTSALKRKIAYGLIDAALTKVVVIDERIQWHVFKSTSMENARFFEKMNIYVPSRNEFDLNEQSYRCRQSGLNMLVSWIDSQILPFQKSRAGNVFLVVHLGVIEKLVGTDTDKIGEWISRYSNEGVSVIITSGRGKPTNIPPKTLFLNYSLVSQYLLDNRSKYHLTKILYASREVKA